MQVYECVKRNHARDLSSMERMFECTGSMVVRCGNQCRDYDESDTDDLKRAQWQLKKSSKKAKKKSSPEQGTQRDHAPAPLQVDPERLIMEMGVEVKTKALSKPRQCRGWDVYKHWDGHGVCHGTITIAALARLGAGTHYAKLRGPPLSPTSRQHAYQSACLLYTSPSPRDQRGSRMPSSA